MTNVFCPNCFKAVEIPLPVEPLYDAETAAALVPTSVGALKKLLNRHKPFEPYYRKWARRWTRSYSTSEIRWCREYLYRRSLPRKQSVTAGGA